MHRAAITNAIEFITCNWLDSGGRHASGDFSSLSCCMVWKWKRKRRRARYEVLVDMRQNALVNAKLSITPHLAAIIKPLLAP